MDQYFSTLLSLDQSPTTLAMLGICLDFCTAQKDKETIEKHKVSSFFYLTQNLRWLYLTLQSSTLCLFFYYLFQSALLDLYIKSVLMSKTKPQQHILDKSGSLLRHVSHSEFKDLLLPTLQKTMLRSPENAIHSKML